ncbi:hypothetical protein [Nitrosophilus labii]|uniref:hypothetical protein n=1 Tax=Nitrosophilus labii TaxID=2706014 RepID=UPI001657626F|nr:hypothetical protein [Nitrosophilus labii]
MNKPISKEEIDKLIKRLEKLHHNELVYYPKSKLIRFLKYLRDNIDDEEKKETIRIWFMNIVLTDYLKLLRKMTGEYYHYKKRKRKYNKKEEIIAFYTIIRSQFSTNKDAILTTANHFNISPKTVERHIYKFKKDKK